MKRISNSFELPLTMGSSQFGCYPKISVELTRNMYMCDGWQTSFFGYKSVANIEYDGVGRRCAVSNKAGNLFFVINNSFYGFVSPNNYTLLGSLTTNSGDVFIAENTANQIGICDKENIYIYDYSTPTPVFSKASLDFKPTFISYHDGYFIAGEYGTNRWRLSEANNGLSWPVYTPGSTYAGLLQTEADTVQAVIPIPGHGNNVLVLGSIVAEIWTDTGNVLFPYTRSTGFNIDYGTINAATIAWQGDRVIWLGGNKKSGTSIFMSDGGNIQRVETSGIAHFLQQLTSPENSSAFFFEIEGHSFYVITFYDPADNVTLAYDLKEKAFYHLTDENGNYFIVKNIEKFNNKYYFVSQNNGKLYELSSQYTDYDGAIIPCERIPPTIRMDDASPFIGNEMSLLLDQGNCINPVQVTYSISRDGNASFGNEVTLPLNNIGYRKNRLVDWGFGYANEMTFKFKFLGDGRFLVKDGYFRGYQ